MAKPVNYLNNKDILKEIHKSKTTFCSFTDKKYADFDIILDDVSKIIPNLELAREARADRLSKQLVASDTDPKPTAISPSEITNTSIVFRIYSWEHIPLLDIVPEATVKPVKSGKKAKSKNIMSKESEELFSSDDPIADIEEDIPAPKLPNSKKYAKVNFPPFVHYVLDENNIPVLVGKSHWKGDINTGEFSKTHGKITDTLAKMYMKLCDRYCNHPWFRRYTYIDEMKDQGLLQLVQVGLQFDESKGANPFAYYTSAIYNSFARVKNIEKRLQSTRDDILEMNGFAPSHTRQNLSDHTAGQMTVNTSTVGGYYGGGDSDSGWDD